MELQPVRPHRLRVDRGGGGQVLLPMAPSQPEGGGAVRAVEDGGVAEEYEDLQIKVRKYALNDFSRCTKQSVSVLAHCVLCT